MSNQEQEEEKKRRTVSGIITGSYVVGLVLLLLFCGMKYMDPPEQIGGIELADFGNSDVGQGNVEELPSQADAQPTDNSPQDQMTDDDSPVKTDKKDEKKKNEKKPEKKPEEKPKVDDRLNKNAFKNKDKGGDGKDGKDGNKGKKDGAKDGTGKDGSGTGGKGTGGGSGIGYSLGGRGALSLPKPGYNSNQQGIVIVEIKVDRSGKVVWVDAPARGSTTNAAALVNAAKQAAYKAKFSANPNGPEKQKGTITYTFKLN